MILRELGTIWPRTEGEPAGAGPLLHHLRGCGEAMLESGGMCKGVAMGREPLCGSLPRQARRGDVRWWSPG